MPYRNNSILLLLIMTSICSVLASCATVHKDWERAMLRDSPQTYGEFITQHPNSEYQKKAEERIEVLSWNDAKRTDSVDAYQKFLQKYPTGRHSKQALAGIDNLNWQSATSEDTVLSYQSYIDKTPKGTHHNDARLRIEKINNEAAEKAKKEEQEKRAQEVPKASGTVVKIDRKIKLITIKLNNGDLFPINFDTKTEYRGISGFSAIKKGHRLSVEYKALFTLHGLTLDANILSGEIIYIATFVEVNP